MNQKKQTEQFRKDLFGAPVGQIRERWGRPAYKKTKENQELVACLRAIGWTKSRIAAEMGCDEETLVKHFSVELDQGPDRVRALMLQSLVAKVKQGNTAAIRMLQNLTDPTPPPARGQNKKPAIGKKGMAEKAARAPIEDQEWSELLNGPRLPN